MSATEDRADVLCISLDVYLRVVKCTIGTGAYLIDNTRFQICENSTWHVFTRASFAKEGVKRVILDILFLRDTAIRLDAMLKAILLFHTKYSIIHVVEEKEKGVLPLFLLPKY